MRRVPAPALPRASRSPSPGPLRLATLAALPVVALSVLALGCGSERGSTTDPDGGGSGATAPAFGEACTADGDCAPGLLCIDGDWAPQPWCGKACDNPGDYCDTLTTHDVGSLCIQLPDDFKGATKQFCAPICTNGDTCSGLWSGWDKCAKPAWKNKALYNDLPTKVCQSPGTHGQVVIDPVVCDWESKITDPKYTNAKQVCKAYCSFLKTCQIWDTSKEKLTCCQWRCFQDMTPGGKVDDAVEDAKKCYVTAFNNAQGTPKVCTLHEEQCQPIGDPHAK